MSEPRCLSLWRGTPGASRVALFAAGAARFFSPFNLLEHAMHKPAAAAEVPPFYSESVFTVAEVAEMLGLEEISIRTWIARGALRWFGRRGGNGRITFSARDVYGLAVVRDLIKYGTEFESAFAAAQGVTADRPTTDVVAVSLDGSDVRVNLRDDPHRLEATAIVVPLVAMWRRTVDAAAEVYGAAA